MDTPQPNPRLHAVDWVALALAVLAAAAEMADMMPAKYAGIVLGLYALSKTYTKFLGSQQQKDALAEGASVGAEIKTDIAVMNAPKAQPVDTQK